MITLKPIYLAYDLGLTFLVDIAVRLEAAYKERVGEEKFLDSRRFPFCMKNYEEMSKIADSSSVLRKTINHATAAVYSFAECRSGEAKEFYELTEKSSRARMVLIEDYQKAIQCFEDTVCVQVVGVKALDEQARDRFDRYFRILEGVEGLRIETD